jgi:hypothetical protein
MEATNTENTVELTRVRTSITIKPEVLDKVKLISAHKGVSVSRFIEEVLAAQFEDQADEVVE